VPHPITAGSHAGRPARVHLDNVRLIQRRFDAIGCGRLLDGFDIQTTASAELVQLFLHDVMTLNNLQPITLGLYRNFTHGRREARAGLYRVYRPIGCRHK